MPKSRQYSRNTVKSLKASITNQNQGGGKKKSGLINSTGGRPGINLFRAGNTPAQRASRYCINQIGSTGGNVYQTRAPADGVSKSGCVTSVQEKAAQGAQAAQVRNFPGLNPNAFLLPPNVPQVQGQAQPPMFILTEQEIRDFVAAVHRQAQFAVHRRFNPPVANVAAFLSQEQVECGMIQLYSRVTNDGASAKHGSTASTLTTTPSTGHIYDNEVLDHDDSLNGVDQSSFEYGGYSGTTNSSTNMTNQEGNSQLFSSAVGTTSQENLSGNKYIDTLINYSENLDRDLHTLTDVSLHTPFILGLDPGSHCLTNNEICDTNNSISIPLSKSNSLFALYNILISTIETLIFGGKIIKATRTQIDEGETTLLNEKNYVNKLLALSLWGDEVGLSEEEAEELDESSEEIPLAIKNDDAAPNGAKIIVKSTGAELDLCSDNIGYFSLDFLAKYQNTLIANPSNNLLSRTFSTSNQMLGIFTDGAKGLIGSPIVPGKDTSPDGISNVPDSRHRLGFLNQTLPFFQGASGRGGKSQFLEAAIRDVIQYGSSLKDTATTILSGEESPYPLRARVYARAQINRLEGLNEVQRELVDKNAELQNVLDTHAQKIAYNKDVFFQRLLNAEQIEDQIESARQSSQSNELSLPGLQTTIGLSILSDDTSTFMVSEKAHSDGVGRVMETDTSFHATTTNWSSEVSGYPSNEEFRTTFINAYYERFVAQTTNTNNSTGLSNAASLAVQMALGILGGKDNLINRISGDNQQHAAVIATTDQAIYNLYLEIQRYYQRIVNKSEYQRTINTQTSELLALYKDIFSSMGFETATYTMRNLRSLVSTYAYSEDERYSHLRDRLTTQVDPTMANTNPFSDRASVVGGPTAHDGASHTLSTLGNSYVHFLSSLLVNNGQNQIMDHMLEVAEDSCVALKEVYRLLKNIHDIARNDGGVDKWNPDSDGDIAIKTFIGYFLQTSPMFYKSTSGEELDQDYSTDSSAQIGLKEGGQTFTVGIKGRLSKIELKTINGTSPFWTDKKVRLFLYDGEYTSLESLSGVTNRDTDVMQPNETGTISFVLSQEVLVNVDDKFTITYRLEDEDGNLISDADMVGWLSAGKYNFVTDLDGSVIPLQEDEHSRGKAFPGAPHGFWGDLETQYDVNIKTYVETGQDYGEGFNYDYSYLPYNETHAPGVLRGFVNGSTSTSEVISKILVKTLHYSYSTESGEPLLNDEYYAALASISRYYTTLRDELSNLIDDTEQVLQQQNIELDNAITSLKTNVNYSGAFNDVNSIEEFINNNIKQQPLATLDEPNGSLLKSTFVVYNFLVHQGLLGEDDGRLDAAEDNLKSNLIDSHQALRIFLFSFAFDYGGAEPGAEATSWYDSAIDKNQGSSLQDWQLTMDTDSEIKASLVNRYSIYGETKRLNSDDIGVFADSTSVFQIQALRSRMDVAATFWSTLNGFNEYVQQAWNVYAETQIGPEPTQTQIENLFNGHAELSSLTYKKIFRDRASGDNNEAFDGVTGVYHDFHNLVDLYNKFVVSTQSPYPIYSQPRRGGKFGDSQLNANEISVHDFEPKDNYAEIDEILYKFYYINQKDANFAQIMHNDLDTSIDGHLEFDYHETIANQNEKYKNITDKMNVEIFNYLFTNGLHIYNFNESTGMMEINSGLKFDYISNDVLSLLKGETITPEQSNLICDNMVDYSRLLELQIYHTYNSSNFDVVDEQGFNDFNFDGTSTNPSGNNTGVYRGNGEANLELPTPVLFGDYNNRLGLVLEVDGVDDNGGRGQRFLGTPISQIRRSLQNNNLFDYARYGEQAYNGFIGVPLILPNGSWTRYNRYQNLYYNLPHDNYPPYAYGDTFFYPSISFVKAMIQNLPLAGSYFPHNMVERNSEDIQLTGKYLGACGFQKSIIRSYIQDWLHLGNKNANDVPSEIWEENDYVIPRGLLPNNWTDDNLMNRWGLSEGVMTSDNWQLINVIRNIRTGLYSFTERSTDAFAPFAENRFGAANPTTADRLVFESARKAIFDMNQNEIVSIRENIIGNLARQVNYALHPDTPRAMLSNIVTIDENVFTIVDYRPFHLRAEKIDDAISASSFLSIVLKIHQLEMIQILDTRISNHKQIQSTQLNNQNSRSLTNDLEYRLENRVRQILIDRLDAKRNLYQNLAIKETYTTPVIRGDLVELDVQDHTSSLVYQRVISSDDYIAQQFYLPTPVYSPNSAVVNLMIDIVSTNQVSDHTLEGGTRHNLLGEDYLQSIPEHLAGVAQELSDDRDEFLQFPRIKSDTATSLNAALLAADLSSTPIQDLDVFDIINYNHMADDEQNRVVDAILNLKGNGRMKNAAGGLLYFEDEDDETAKTQKREEVKALLQDPTGILNAGELTDDDGDGIYHQVPQKGYPWVNLLKDGNNVQYESNKITTSLVLDCLVPPMSSVINSYLNVPIENILDVNSFTKPTGEDGQVQAGYHEDNVGTTAYFNAILEKLLEIKQDSVLLGSEDNLLSHLNTDFSFVTADSSNANNRDFGVLLQNFQNYGVNRGIQRNGERIYSSPNLDDLVDKEGFNQLINDVIEQCNYRLDDISLGRYTYTGVKFNDYEATYRELISLGRNLLNKGIENGGASVSFVCPQNGARDAAGNHIQTASNLLLPRGSLTRDNGTPVPNHVAFPLRMEGETIDRNLTIGHITEYSEWNAEEKKTNGVESIKIFSAFKGNTSTGIDDVDLF